MGEPPDADLGEPSSSEPLVFVSDRTDEGERLGVVLRARGYSVVDVPLEELSSRASLRLPSLVLCDADAAGALDAIRRLTKLPESGEVELVLLGESQDAFSEVAQVLGHEPSAVFARPVDVRAVLRQVESVVGAPSGLPGGALMPPSSRAARSSHPARLAPSSQPRAPEPSSPGPEASIPPVDVELPPVASSSAPPRDPALFPTESVQPSSGEPSLPIDSEGSYRLPPSYDDLERPSSHPFDSLAAEAKKEGLPSQIPQAQMSTELAQLLEQAEKRVEQRSSVSSSPPAERPTPDEELRAVIPPDVLASLDEPLKVGDESEGHGSGSVPGTRNGSEGGRTGTGTGERPTGSALGSPGATGVDAGGPHVDAGPTIPPESVDFDSEQPSFEAGQTPTGLDTTGGSSAPPAGKRERPTSAPPAGKRERPTSAPPAMSRQSKPTSAPPSASKREALTSAPPALAREAPTPAPPSPRGTTATTGVQWDAGQPPKALPPDRAAPTLSPDESSGPRIPSTGFTPPPVPHGLGLDSAPPERTSASTTPPGGRLRTEPAPAPPPPVEIPSTLGPKDAARAMARIIRARHTGSLALESEEGLRRIIFRDGDFVTAASGVEGESLVDFLIQRGALAPELAAELSRKLPPFGRHAGAGLIAHGHLRQDELWPALRAHAEWLIGRAIGIRRGVASLEQDIPARLNTEPAVFGGATGAEVFVEIVRRAVGPAQATERLGGSDARLIDGPAISLLGECQVSTDELALLARAKNSTVGQVIESASSPDVAAVLYALTELSVLRRTAPSVEPPAEPPAAEWQAQDNLDNEARRAKIKARRALVEEADYFAVLGLDPSATPYEIRRAYLDARREFEPHRMLTTGTVDLRDELEQIVEVLDEAFEILRDQVRRDRYRRALEASP